MFTVIQGFTDDKAGESRNQEKTGPQCPQGKRETIRGGMRQELVMPEVLGTALTSFSSLFIYFHWKTGNEQAGLALRESYC